MENVLTPELTFSVLVLANSYTEKFLRPLFNLILFDVSATSNNVDYFSLKTLSFLSFHHSIFSHLSSYCLFVLLFMGPSLQYYSFSGVSVMSIPFGGANSRPLYIQAPHVHDNFQICIFCSFSFPFLSPGLKMHIYYFL